MSTYSIGTPPTDATKLESIQAIFNELPDNTSKLISPKDVRDAAYTIWENIIFKPTTIPSSSVEYIGIDQDGFNEKILIGKKDISGQYVLSDDLLNSNVDIFFYNTKSGASYDTKIAFLAGTGSNFQSGNVSAPYIQSTVVTNPGFENTIDFEIVNPSYYINGLTYSGGNINILSEYGVVSLNGIVMPTYNNNLDPSSDGEVLTYKWWGGRSYAVWQGISQSSITSLTSSGTVSISGSPVLLNGLDVNFSYDVPTPVAIGGIPAGSTFSNVPVTEMIRMILYPYIMPVLSTSISSQYVETTSATSSNLTFNYSITRNATYSISSITLSATFSGLLITPGSIVNGTTSSSVGISPAQLTGTQSWNTQTWTMGVSDTYISTATSSSSVSVVIPWYYGSATISCTSSTTINTILGTSSTSVPGKLTPLLTAPALTSSSIYNKGVTMSGNNVYLYFGYPYDFPDLVSIIDPNGYDVSGSFYKFTVDGVSSPSSIWGSTKNYKFYIYVGSTASTTPITTTIGAGPAYSETYQFNFA